jgi:hypothetical protein
MYEKIKRSVLACLIVFLTVQMTVSMVPKVHPNYLELQSLLASAGKSADVTPLSNNSKLLSRVDSFDISSISDVLTSSMPKDKVFSVFKKLVFWEKDLVMRYVSLLEKTSKIDEKNNEDLIKQLIMQMRKLENSVVAKMLMSDFVNDLVFSSYDISKYTYVQKRAIAIFWSQMDEFGVKSKKRLSGDADLFQINGAVSVFSKIPSDGILSEMKAIACITDEQE